VVRQARSNAIPINLLTDFFEVTKERGRVFDIAVRATPFGISIARHAPLAV
jgi:hypothetical protein